MIKHVITVVVALAVSASGTMAQEVKVGIVLPYTGVGAEISQQMDRGMDLYLKLNAADLKPYTIKLIKRDSKNASGADAKIAVQELIAQDKVDVLAGWFFSPNAIASAPLVHASGKLSIIMNAGTAFITKLAPEFVRTSASMWQAGYAMGIAAAKTLHARTAVAVFSDFPPGKDSVEAFKVAFEANGGKLIDIIPAGGPGAVPDFTPFLQRAKDEKPDVLYVFTASADHALAMVKTYAALGLRGAGIKLIGPGDIVQDLKLQSMGDAAIGVITMHHYNADLNNPQNKRFVDAWKHEYGPDATPDFAAVGAYDGMAAIVHAIQATNGKMDGKAAVASLLGWRFNSPQGPIMIDPKTRDIVMDEYLVEVVRGDDNKLHEKVLDRITEVKDMCKELGVGPCADKK